jgi:hypothetical protein
MKHTGTVAFPNSAASVKGLLAGLHYAYHSFYSLCCMEYCFIAANNSSEAFLHQMTNKPNDYKSYGVWAAVTI